MISWGIISGIWAPSIESIEHPRINPRRSKITCQWTVCQVSEESGVFFKGLSKKKRRTLGKNSHHHLLMGLGFLWSPLSAENEGLSASFHSKRQPCLETEAFLQWERSQECWIETWDSLTQSRKRVRWLAEWMKRGTWWTKMGTISITKTTKGCN